MEVHVILMDNVILHAIHKNVKNVKMVLAKISVYLERKFVMDKMDKEHVHL